MNNFTLYDTTNPQKIYFEHNRLGENCAGGMWFENKTLIDYDGVFDLPKEVLEHMLSQGYDMSYVTDISEYGELPHSEGTKNE